MIAFAPSFSTVYNLLLCLHIFSVHITHQSKKRKYENLDQLSYDNKRGPKVYMHGRARRPLTREPWPLAPRPLGPCLGPAEPQARAVRREVRRQAAAGRRGQERPHGSPRTGPSVAAAASAWPESGHAAGEAALREVHANLWDPQGFLVEPRREPTRPAARLPAGVRATLQGPVASGLRGSPVVLAKSAPSLLPVAFQNSFSLCPLHALCVSAHFSLHAQCKEDSSDRCRER